MTNAAEVGEQIAFHRRRAGLSQVQFAGLVNRSESWVSQVERGARSVDRLSVLQKVADVLGVSVAELRGSAETSATESTEQAGALEDLRLALTGHPALAAVLDSQTRPVDAQRLVELREQHTSAWTLVHNARYTELAPALAELILSLEQTVRETAEPAIHAEARQLLTDAYQAAAAVLAKLSENDAAWIAADRAVLVAETAGKPLLVGASMFRMAHVFLSLRQLTQAHQVAGTASNALEPHTSSDSTPEALSLYGAFQLVLAVVAARDNDRAEAQAHLAKAREIADRLGEDRNDFDTEFGPTNVAIHAVSIAVELGDAGTALELAGEVDTSALSAERQARFLIDVAKAQTMRRQIGEAFNSLKQAEELTPEQVRVLKPARETAQELIQLTGNRARPELRNLAGRFGVLP